MPQRIVKMLQSKDRSKRLRGWAALRDGITEHQISITERQHRQFRSLLDREDDDGVREMGLRVLLDLAHTIPPASHLPSGTKRERNQSDSKPLAEWVWDPFHRPSVVFGVAADGYQKRDENALIALARTFPHTEFPDTDIVLVRLESEDWRQKLHERHVQSICFVGRLALYGDAALSCWKNPRARFAFLKDERPSSLPRGNLHEEYHCIVEYIGNEETEEHHSTDHDGRRTDYALVQRYTIVDGAKHVVVVSVAGATALGTEAVANWLARDLREPTDPFDESPIAAPADVRGDSQMEALLKVTADISNSPWKVTHVELQKLFVDNLVWSKENRRWNILPPRSITLTRQDGQITNVLFDGKPTSLKKGSQIFRLLVEATLAAGRRRDRVIDVGKLAKNREIWAGKTKGGKSVSETYARRQLSLLKTRYLGAAIEIDRQVRLNAAVEIHDIAADG